MSDHAQLHELISILHNYADHNGDQAVKYLATEFTAAYELGEASECDHCIRENVGLPAEGECPAD